MFAKFAGAKPADQTHTEKTTHMLLRSSPLGHFVPQLPSPASKYNARILLVSAKVAAARRSTAALRVYETSHANAAS